MDQNPLVIEQTDAGAEFVRRFHEFMPVEAAFWINPADDGQWTLHVASEKISDQSLDLGYGEALRLVREMRTPYLDPFQVRLLGTAEPLAQAALDILHRYPGSMAIRIGGRYFGGQGIEGAYIYPASITATVP